MQQLFNPDSKLMVWLGRFANLFILNLLTLICSLPLITIGSAFTAMHKVLLSIYRHEDGHLFKSYFLAFTKNFRQATIIWVLTFAHLLLLFAWLYGISKNIIAVPAVMVYLLYASAVLLIVLWSWVFILQSRYQNPIWATVKNAIILGVAHPGRTILMTALFVCPFLLVMFTQSAEPLIICLGFSCPGILQAKLYGPVIDKIDQMIQESVESGDMEAS